LTQGTGRDADGFGPAGQPGPEFPHPCPGRRSRATAPARTAGRAARLGTAHRQERGPEGRSAMPGSVRTGRHPCGVRVSLVSTRSQVDVRQPSAGPGRRDAASSMYRWPAGQQSPSRARRAATPHAVADARPPGRGGTCGRGNGPSSCFRFRINGAACGHRQRRDCSDHEGAAQQVPRRSAVRSCRGPPERFSRRAVVCVTAGPRSVRCRRFRGDARRAAAAYRVLGPLD